jgi:hypothetical protein
MKDYRPEEVDPMTALELTETIDEHRQLKRYRQLMEDLHDLALVAERRDEEPINLNEAAAN